MPSLEQDLIFDGPFLRVGFLDVDLRLLAAGELVKVDPRLIALLEDLVELVRNSEDLESFHVECRLLLQTLDVALILEFFHEWIEVEP